MTNRENAGALGHVETGGVRSRGGRLPRTYDAEFRRRVVELVRAGRPVRMVVTELGLAEETSGPLVLVARQS